MVVELAKSAAPERSQRFAHKRLVPRSGSRRLGGLSADGEVATFI